MQAQSIADTCTIRVTATDPFGQPVSDYSLELRNRNGTIIKLGRSGDSFRAVPFGEYTLVAINDCCRSQRDLIVNIPSMWVRLGVPIRFGDPVLPGGDLVIRGIIHAIPRIAGDKWVRVRGVFLDFSREVEIGSDSRFSIEGLDMGSYVVEVFVAAKHLYSQIVEIDPRTPVTNLLIHLDKRP
jgi:hypothetical protein